VVLCQYKSKGSVKAPGNAWSSIFYIHSKTWFFDDEYLITGSANCNRRGYSHDSELDVGVYDQDKKFVKDFRVKLWKRRLNTEGIIRSPLQDNDLIDFLRAAKYWENPSQYGLTIENNRTKSLAPVQYPDLNLQSYKAKVTGQPGVDPAISGLIDSLKMDGLWDFVVDPDGT
jgi:phosphatidylserine/phosphatidylglycerophosphate/cardiolipin synthase-like enzyme